MLDDVTYNFDGLLYLLYHIAPTSHGTDRVLVLIDELHPHSRRIGGKVTGLMGDSSGHNQSGLAGIEAHAPTYPYPMSQVMSSFQGRVLRLCCAGREKTSRYW